MRTDSLKKDDKGVMIFALIGVVILLLSIYAGVYFSSIRMDSQEDVVDLGEIRKIERELDRIEKELNSAAEEAGYQAVESVRDEVLDGDTLYSLKKRIAYESARNFEDYFERRNSDRREIRGFDIELSLRPIEEAEEGIELVPLYLAESGKRSKIPGFFQIDRTVQVHIEDPSGGTISTLRLDIDREVKTDIFVLAERARNFDIREIRKMTDCMMSAYLNAKVFSGAIEEKIGYKEDFSESFSTSWLKNFSVTSSGNGGERKEPWIKNSTGFIEGFERDIGDLELEELLSKEDLIATAELAMMIEQIRVFRSHDDSLLASVSDHFGLSEKEILDYIGEGDKNRVNLQRLIVTLFQEKGELLERVFYPDMFLSGMMEEDIPGIIGDSEDWTETSFSMINELVKGALEGEDNWDYMEFDENTFSIEELDEHHSYLRLLFSMYSNIMGEVLKSFKVNSEEVESLVFDEIKGIGPLLWMDDIEIIGDSGTDEIVKSILYRSENLSMSFGFDEGSYGTTAFPFYYMYFLNDWGFSPEEENGKDPSDQLEIEGIENGVKDKIRSEMRSRAEDLEKSANSSFNQVTDMIEGFNETGWYEAENEAQEEMWDNLNETLEPLSALSNARLFEFDRSDPPHVSDELKENHTVLEDNIGVVEDIKTDLGKEPKEYTENILEMERNYTGIEWRAEVYDDLYFEDDFGGDFFNNTDYLLTASPEEISSPYNWSLQSFRLEDHIDRSRRIDQSIGQRVLGNFTDEMVREWESPTPMNYTNPRGLFKLINQNLFQLTGSREESGKNRLRSILRGSGDPSSDNLGEEDIPSSSVELIEGPVSSADDADINKWVMEDSLNRTIDSLKNITVSLQQVSQELIDREIEDGVYSNYADASFYRTAERFLDPMIDSMKEYRDRIQAVELPTGYPGLGNESGYRRKPVISVPRGELTLFRSIEAEDDGLSYSLDLDIDMSPADDLVEVEGLDTTTTRVYTGRADNAYEWINPFSRKSGDHYRTVFTMDYSTKGFKLDLGPKESAPLVSQRYSSSTFTVEFDERKHKSLAETASPLPVLQTKYAPRPSSPPEIERISLDKNVFNGSEERLGINLELTDEEDIEEEVLVEVIKRDEVSDVSTGQRDRLMNLDHLYYNETEEDNEQEILARKWIAPGELEEGEFDLDIDTMDVQPEEIYSGHISVSIRSELELSYMKGEKDLDQSSAEETYHSPVPSLSVSEQAYIFGDGRTELGVFRAENGPQQRYTYDMIREVPEESWIIRKNGFNYLVDLEDCLEIRDSLSGRYRGPLDDHTSAEIPIDPVSDVKGEVRSRAFLPNNTYGRLLETDLLPIYMKVSVDENYTVPERMIPVPGEVGGRSWEDLKAKLLESQDLLHPSTKDDFHLYHEIDEYHGKIGVNHSFQRSKKAVIDPGIVRNFHFSSKSNGLKKLREADLIHDFSNASLSRKRDLFLASCYGSGKIETVQELSAGEFELGPVAKSIGMIGEESTRELLDWLKEEREDDRSSDLRAFLSLDEHLVKELPSKTEADDYSEALDELDDLMGGMTFVEARNYNIVYLDDIESLDQLRQDSDEETLLTAAGLGVKPSALEDLLRKKPIELDVLVDSMSKFSDSSYFRNFVRELNSRVYDHVPALYVAGTTEILPVTWMPYGGESPHLIIDGKLAQAEIASVDSLSKLKGFVDGALERANKDNSSERVKVIIEVPDFSPKGGEMKEVRNFVESKTREHDPRYSNVSSVSLKFAGDREVNYFHL